MTPLALLDTDTLSYLMRQDQPVLRSAAVYLAEHGRFNISILTQYGILRGLKAKQATTQVAAFENFCSANNVLELSKPIVVRAAEIYGDLHRRGTLIGDADILIAATAQVHSLCLVTNNTRHFGGIVGLRLLNWFGQ
jgi:tRNA(fMet)-specific endonuclease VapC